MPALQNAFKIASWAQLTLSFVTFGALLLTGLSVMTMLLAVMASLYIVLAAAAFGRNRFVVAVAAVATIMVGASAAFALYSYGSSDFDFTRGRRSLPADVPVLAANPAGEVIVVENAPPELRARMTPFDPLPYAALLAAILAALVVYGYVRAWTGRRALAGRSGSSRDDVGRT